MPAGHMTMLSRVLMLHTARGAGAGFVIDRRKRQWLVTAAHVVPVDPVVEIDLVLASGRSRVALPRLPVTAGAAEIAVFALDEPVLAKDTSIEASNNGLLMGQDVHLFGFPLVGYGAWRTDSGVSLPFVRRGCMGGTMGQAGTRMLLVDAISDPGMAGGPATFTHERNSKPHIAGVIIDPHRDHDQPLNLPLGITQVVSIDHVIETVDAWRGR